MEEHHVYQHYHHHYHYHYHYHYNYPFPPGLTPNDPQNNELLNQEVADRENDEPPAENEEDEEENEHIERGDTEDQRHPENRSSSPVQQEERLAHIETSRVGLAVFDDYFSLFNLDAQSAKAQARWTNTQPNNEDHREGPPRKKARTSASSGQPISRGDSSNTSTQPRQSGNITVINKALVISADKAFRVFNCDPSGPQVNICWRVPGPRNLWLARIGEAIHEPLKSIKFLMEAERKPGYSLTTFMMSLADAEGTISMILCSSTDRNYEDFERGEGVVVNTGQGDHKSMSALGRLVGFEVVRGYVHKVDKGCGLE